ncbi:MAG TPA: dienelactone hydrolase family protein [Ignavibacteriaceae bacterium]|nr:dienelactone hydrolase family protein [Ignavibacteriaceae bacterium]
MKYSLISLLFLFTALNCGEKKEQPKTEEPSLMRREVLYTAGGSPMKGYISYDASKKGKRPGIIVVHEWWGNNDYSRMRADMLADSGYIALSVDMFGNGKQADNPKDAQNLAMGVMQNPDTLKTRFLAGLALLKEQEQTDSTKIAAIGYCFGGGVVLNIALAGADLDGVASFHGMLPTDKVKKPGNVKAKMLVCAGDADPFVPKETADKFKKAMDDAGVDYKFVSYPDAKHAFTNPDADSLGKKFNIPIAYNGQADLKSWAELMMFLHGLFK